MGCQRSPQPSLRSPHRSAALEAVRQFTPSWFSASMSTGIVGLVIAGFPYGAPAKLEIVSGRSLAPGAWARGRCGGAPCLCDCAWPCCHIITLRRLHLQAGLGVLVGQPGALLRPVLDAPGAVRLLPWFEACWPLS